MTRSEYQTLIDTLADNQPNTAATVRNILGALADGATFTGEMKAMEVDTSYIAANFDGSGLGTNEMVGYAICNGQNGTRDWRGRTPLGYDSVNYPTLGAIGGSKDAVLVAHTHSVATSPNDALGYVTAKSSSATGGTPINTSSAGESGVGKNLPPYRVTLFVQKII
jgi:hypothetical protein